VDIGTREVVTAGVRGFGQMDRGARKLVNVETVRLSCAWKAALYMGMASLCRFGRDGSVMQRLLVENEEGLVVASVFMPIFSFETVLLGEGVSLVYSVLVSAYQLDEAAWRKPIQGLTRRDHRGFKYVWGLTVMVDFWWLALLSRISQPRD